LPEVDEARAGVAPRHVLVAIDRSPEGWSALEEGIDVAERCHAVLTLVAVAERPGWWLAGVAGMAPLTHGDVAGWLEDAALRSLALARDHVPGSISILTRVVRGPARRARARAVSSGRYDLVLWPEAVARRRPR
jgi:nucleotide-binding universal stress UspA family protein